MAALPHADEVRDDPHLIARAFVERPDELPAAIVLSKRRGLLLEYDRASLTVRLRIEGPAPELDAPPEPYLITGTFDDYRALPPIWRFVHPVTGADVGTAGYPAHSGESVMHPSGVICAHWNRLAYSDHGGPHPDWGGPANWQNPVTGTVALTIPDMLDRLTRDVAASRGRMAPLPS